MKIQILSFVIVLYKKHFLCYIIESICVSKYHHCPLSIVHCPFRIWLGKSEFEESY